MLRRTLAENRAAVNGHSGRTRAVRGADSSGIAVLKFTAVSPDLSIAREYKRRVLADFDGRVAKLVLYGSRARGDARPDSDWDIAVFMKDDPTPDDLDRLSDLGVDLLYETGQYVQPMPMPARRLHEDSTLLTAIRSEGLPL